MIIVVLESEPDRRYHYGPFASRAQADKFADFLSSEVDPAHVADMWDLTPLQQAPLRSPLAEMLAWYREYQDEGEDLDAEEAG